MTPKPQPSGRYVVAAIFAAGMIALCVLFLWRPARTPAHHHAATVPVDADDPTVAAAQGHGHNAEYLARHEAYVAQAARGGIDVLFLGDSITDDMRRFPAFWQRTWEPLRAVNFGIDHDKTQNLLWRIEHGELAGISPKLVVVLIGTNNTEDNTPARIADGVRAVVESVRSQLPRARVLLMGLFPRNPKPTAEKRQIVREVNALLRPLDDGQTVRFLDIGDSLLEKDGTLSPAIMPDGLHPSEKGYQIWADRMRPLLNEWLTLPGNR